MSDYDLSGLSTRSFEKLIQAIAGRVLGPGTITFGDGPDGGREATFEGRMDYPSQADPWDGYCVIQAKFLQRTQNPGKDGRWVSKQLNAELKKYASSKTRRRLPDYYVFATNVTLTPVQDQGGKDQASEVVKKHLKKVPLRNWAIWDFDEIGKFLDMYIDIRTTYAAWITPGDVLHAVMRAAYVERPTFLEIMSNFLAKELRSAHFANLEQAGHSTEERVPLARVFVDLPTSNSRMTNPPDDEPEQAHGIAEIVATLLTQAKDRLDPASLYEGRGAPENRGSRSEDPQPGRFVLVGGPGQGKTTVGQFACQVFRAALLRDRPRHLLPPEVQDPLSTISDQCNAGPLKLPTTRRFPVWVGLSELADALSKDKNLSILGFISAKIGRRTGRNVSLDDLRSWLSVYPWFIVFDGLDEVPPSSNRDDVLKKVEDFWIDASQVNADVLVLATTRPQGYGEEFSPLYYRHLWLTPLSVKRAMSYARRLVAVRYDGEVDRQQKILGRLQQASRQESTARLMRSPLQITIMAALVDQTGTPPQDRWRLFHDYYDVIYNRERERSISPADLLREYKPNIDAIHHQVGLILQVESERAGGTDAKLPVDRFAALVTARLEAEGFSGVPLAGLRDRIMEAAANRLVFLVGLETGQVGFEIRSLQEYMAAEAIMTGSHDKIQERLRQFAGVVSWRNVFLFAAGRCFLQEQHLRDTVYTICVELNDQLGGAVGRLTLAGSALALDLLEDGVVARQPKYARLLAQCAVRLLELPPGEVHGRLADVCQGDVETIVREEIETRLRRPGPDGLSAWSTLFGLIGRGLGWAVTMADEAWPPGREDQLLLLSLPNAGRGSAWFRPRLESVVFRSSPYDTMFLYRYWHERRREHVSGIMKLWLHVAEYMDPEVALRFVDFEIRCGITTVDTGRGASGVFEVDGRELHPGWTASIEQLKFLRAPSKETLASALRHVAKAWRSLPQRWYFAYQQVWVFSACIRGARSADELERTAERAADGDLGDLADWRMAEQRWKGRGITSADLDCIGGERWPFGRDIAERGFPIAGIGNLWDATTRGESRAMANLVERFVGAPRILEFVGPWVHQWIMRLSGWWSAPPMITPSMSMLLLSGVAGRPGVSDVDFALGVANWALNDLAWLDVLEELARTGRWESYYRPDEISVDACAALFSQDPSRVYLLPLIAAGLNRRSAASTSRLNPSRMAKLPRVHVESYRQARVQWAAVMLELVQDGMEAERSMVLAEATIRLLGEGVGGIYELRSVVARNERFSEATERYFLELSRLLPEADWRSRSAVVGGLSDSFRRRDSGIARRKSWEALALPQELLELVMGGQG